jgi:hypothetical protein
MSVLRSHEGGLAFLGGVFVLIAAWLAFRGVSNLCNGLASASWPEAEGRIVRSSLVGTPDGSHVEIRYQYSVEGTQYSSDKIAFGQAWTSSSKAEMVERYAKGTPALVRYRPSDPHVAVLETGFRWGVYMDLLGVTAFGGFGALALHLGLRGRRPTARELLGAPVAEPKVT